VEAHPSAERPERLGESDEPRFVLLPAPRAFGIAEIEPIDARILRDDKQLLDAGADQLFGLAQKLQVLLRPSEIFK
jgi:hypothetical protein